MFYCCMRCRHVDVRTTPQTCYVFTLRTHPAVQPGTIAFNAPQVSVCFSSFLLVRPVWVPGTVVIEQAQSISWPDAVKGNLNQG